MKKMLKFKMAEKQERKVEGRRKMDREKISVK